MIQLSSSPRVSHLPALTRLTRGPGVKPGLHRPSLGQASRGGGGGGDAARERMIGRESARETQIEREKARERLKERAREA